MAAQADVILTSYNFFSAGSLDIFTSELTYSCLRPDHWFVFYCQVCSGSWQTFIMTSTIAALLWHRHFALVLRGHVIPLLAVLVEGCMATITVTARGSSLFRQSMLWNLLNLILTSSYGLGNYYFKTWPLCRYYFVTALILISLNTISEDSTIGTCNGIITSAWLRCQNDLLVGYLCNN